MTAGTLSVVRSVERAMTLDLILIARPLRDVRGYASDATVEFANDAWRTAFGTEGNDPSSRRLLEQFPAFGNGVALMAHAVETGQTICRLDWIVGGGSRRFALQITPDGERVVVVGHEVMPGESAEEALPAASAYARGLIEASLDPLVTISPDGKITDVNAATEQITGVSREALIGTDFADYFTEPTHARAGYELVLADGVVRDYPLTIRGVSGRTTDVLYNATVYANASGVIQGVFAAARDITAQKAVQEVLREQARLLDLAHDAITVLDTESRITYWSAGAEETYGWTSAEACGRVSHELLQTVFPVSLAALQAEVAASGDWRGELRHTDRDGRRLVVESRWSVLRDELGRVRSTLEINRDVTERKVAEEKLQSREAELAEAQRIAHVGSWTRDLATKAVVWSDELFRIFGLDPTDGPPSRAQWDSLLSPETRKAFLTAEERAIRTGLPVEVPVGIVRPDGGIRQAIARVEAALGGDGSIARTHGTVSDVTELREAQARLDLAQRAEIVGRLAGGVAHDFNNLLVAINGYAEFLADGIPAGDPLHEDVEAIQEAGSRAAELTRQLLAFGRRQTLRPAVVDVNEVLAGLSSILRSLVGAGVEIATSDSGRVARARVDRNQLEQAITNLVLNARDAMPAGGRIAIETADETVGPEDARLRPPAAPGHYVRLTVTDAGTGIAPDILAHIFEPFFTTKVLGRGTGLGLSSVEGAVAQSGGFLTVASDVGIGSSFSVFLPFSGEDLTPSPERRGPGAAHTERHATILVVEDEQAVRSIATRTLREFGHTVVEAADPAHALEEAATTSIDLLLTDIVMPGMNGRELAEHLVSENPELRVVYMSGYSPETVFGDGLLAAGTPFLPKPFAREELVSRVQAALERRVADA